MRMTLTQIADWALNRRLPQATPGPAAPPPDPGEYPRYVDMLHRKFVVFNNATNVGDCNFYVGDEGLPDDLRHEIISARSHLHGIPVSFVPGAVGAIILPPNYKQATLAKAKAAPKKVRTRAKKEL